MKKLFIVIFCLAGFALTFEVVRDINFWFSKNSDDPAFKVILISPGSFSKTSDLLYKEGLIKDAKRFVLMARLLRKTGKVKAGEYEVKLNMSPHELLKVITSGKSVLHAVHIPEGFNIDQIADDLARRNLVDRNEFIKLARDPRMAMLLGIDEPTLEGYLYPETYSFEHFTGERVIIKTMVDKFKEVYNREIKFGAEKLGYSMHFVVTLASIVEKETGAPEERPLIASVFHNRLKINMMLQSDPTILYGKHTLERKNITKEDIRAKTPYNTYTRKGLPVGPISNPGKESMLAVIEPAESKYIYFVSKNNGTHQFSVTYGEHNNAVKKFQMDVRARAGKSWRDRLKKNSKQAI
ncbi:MAG: endolytic transglycosylase MltG [Oligoflexia bacterium]|nr:endolytic transglycosylase MltG [Oligoflexia bacterium]